MTEMVPLEPLDVIALVAAHEHSVPVIPAAFVALAAERGWKLGCDWAQDWDEELREYVGPGWWETWLYRHESDHYCAMQVPVGEHYRMSWPSGGYPELWDAFLRLADAEWQRITAGDTS